MTEFNEAGRGYLRSQRLGRMATMDEHGQPQANPVGFLPQDDGTILVLAVRRSRSRPRTAQGSSGHPRRDPVDVHGPHVAAWRYEPAEERGVAADGSPIFQEL
ncbi:pyridoxamine 5'-phosphate oxidase family protein [Streptomyces sp. NPDC057565]|uniref:pyridoxamine 5'-phosphate oxidase family protein n=1 Tax=Streptomyces sp. NPDC057565 TaxID=3346169 RepID=UPI00369665C0